MAIIRTLYLYFIIENFEFTHSLIIVYNQLFFSRHIFTHSSACRNVCLNLAFLWIIVFLLAIKSLLWVLTTHMASIERCKFNKMNASAHSLLCLFHDKLQRESQLIAIYLE